MLEPQLPQIGEHLEIFGLQGRVVEIVPNTDWSWLIGLSSVSCMGNVERWHIEVPTDFRTIDGMCVTDA